MKEDSVHARIQPEMKKGIQALVDKGDYRDITEFVQEAIRDKLEPDRIRSGIKDHLRSLIVNDPEIRQLIAGINEKK